MKFSELLNKSHSHVNEAKDVDIRGFFYNLLKISEKSKGITVSDINKYNLDKCVDTKELIIDVSKYNVETFEEQCEELEKIVKTACKPYKAKYEFYEDSYEFEITIGNVELYVRFE